MKFLESCDKPVTRKQIAEALEAEVNYISRIIRTLLRWSEIEFIEHPSEKVKELTGYDCCRRTRFYFVKKEI